MASWRKILTIASQHSTVMIMHVVIWSQYHEPCTLSPFHPCPISWWFYYSNDKHMSKSSAWMAKTTIWYPDHRSWQMNWPITISFSDDWLSKADLYVSYGWQEQCHVQKLNVSAVQTFILRFLHLPSTWWFNSISHDGRHSFGFDEIASDLALHLILLIGLL